MSETNDAPATGTSNGRNGRRRLLLLLLALVCVVGVAGWTVYHFAIGRWYESTDDAYVQGDLVQITPQVAGTIVSLHADDNDWVEAGQVLVDLDPADATVALHQAEANLARTVRQVRGMYSNVAGLEAQVAQRLAERDKAAADFDRSRRLVGSGAVSVEVNTNNRLALAAAESALESTRKQLATARALVEGTEVASHPDVRAATADLVSAYLDHARVRLMAPVAGYVARRSAQVGQRVTPGTPMMAVVPLDRVWVDANFKETQLKEMRIGQKVELTADLYGGDIVYHGEIAGLGIGTGSAFSLLPAQNATGNWIKIVQRLPVRVVLDPKDLQTHPLRIGLSMTVTVDTHDRDGPVLSRTQRREPVAATDVYAGSLREAQDLASRIIRENSGMAAAPAAADGEAIGGKAQP